MLEGKLKIEMSHEAIKKIIEDFFGEKLALKLSSWWKRAFLMKME